MDHTDIDMTALKARIPLWQDHWLGNLKRVRFHPDAPAWNAECGDRQTEEDQRFVLEYKATLEGPRQRSGEAPSSPIIDWVHRVAEDSLFFQERLHGLNLKRHPERDWKRLAPMTRDDLQRRLVTLVPCSVSLDRLIVNPTSGTTGQPILCPSHPRAQGCYGPLDEFALSRFGMQSSFGPHSTVAVQLCCQRETIVYNTVHSYFGGAAFAKVNIHPDVWDSEQAAAFLQDMDPVFLSGDPYAFQVAMVLGIRCRPQVLLSTALTLDSGLRQELEAWFGAPICDIYSLNETGPLAYSDPGNPGAFRILPSDVYVEILDPEGRPAKEGELGEIAVSGGRNPYLPLLRYRTGDWASLHYDPEPCLRNFQGRGAVVFTSRSGRSINPIDLGRIFRLYPIRAHRFTQHSDGTCTLEVDAPALGSVAEGRLLAEVGLVMEGLAVRLVRGLESLGGKVVPYVREGAGRA